MSHLLSGVHEQSYIADVMAFSACVGEYKLECNRKALGGGSTTSSRITVALLLLPIGLGIFRS